MVMDKYQRLRWLKLCELSTHLTRSEQDLEERLAAREQQVREAGDDKPDPIRKRLFFLLLKHRSQRRAVDEALATREDADESQLLAFRAPSSRHVELHGCYGAGYGPSNHRRAWLGSRDPAEGPPCVLFDELERAASSNRAERARRTYRRGSFAAH